MSFYNVNVLTKLPVHFNEQQWVKQVQRTLATELEEKIEVPVTIFAIPKQLMVIDPDSYTPQKVAIGPYHQLRLDLYETQRYKVVAAKRNQKDLNGMKLKEFVNRLLEYELQIRANYHRPLNCGSDALAWMMAIDACFVLEFLQVCGFKKGKVLIKDPSRFPLLSDLLRNKALHNIILQDITMLENQIPLFVMRMLLEFHVSSTRLADEMLLDMMINVAKELCPFAMAKPCKKVKLKDCAHLLDCLYTFTVSTFKAASHYEETVDILEIEGDDTITEPHKDSNSNNHVQQLCHEINKILSKVKHGPISLISKLEKPIKNICQVFLGKKNQKEGEESSSQNHLVLEQIKIPSVTQLKEVGVTFLPTNASIEGIAFDAKRAILHLPIVELDVNSKVILKNMVAFETCNAIGPSILTRYTEIMNGIIDTTVDVEILCRKRIIINHLKSDQEVADLWNGMSKSIKMAKVPSLDRVIREVNVYYNGRWKVKCRRMIDIYVFKSWRILTCLATIMLLLLMSFQAFCQVYSCNRFIAKLMSTED